MVRKRYARGKCAHFLKNLFIVACMLCIVTGLPCLLTGCDGQSKSVSGLAEDSRNGISSETAQSSQFSSESIGGMSDRESAEQIETQNLPWQTGAASQPEWQTPDEDGNYYYFNPEADIEETQLYDSEQLTITAEKLEYQADDCGGMACLTITAVNKTDHELGIRAFCNEFNYPSDQQIVVNGYLLAEGDDFYLSVPAGEQKEGCIYFYPEFLQHEGITELADIEVNFYVEPLDSDESMDSDESLNDDESLDNDETSTGEYTGYCQLKTSVYDTHDELQEGLNAYSFTQSETPDRPINVEVSAGDVRIRQVLSATGSELWDESGAEEESATHNSLKAQWSLKIELENTSDRDLYVNFRNWWLNGVQVSNSNLYSGEAWPHGRRLPAGRKQIFYISYNDLLPVDLFELYDVGNIYSVEFTLTEIPVTAEYYQIDEEKNGLSQTGEDGSTLSETSGDESGLSQTGEDSSSLQKLKTQTMHVDLREPGNTFSREAKQVYQDDTLLVQSLGMGIDYDYSRDESYEHYYCLLLVTNVSDHPISFQAYADLESPEGGYLTSDFTLEPGEKAAVHTALPDNAGAEDIYKNGSAVTIHIIPMEGSDVDSISFEIN